MHTKITQSKFFTAKIVVFIVVLAVLLFLGFLALSKLLEKNILGALTSKDLSYVITVSANEEARSDFAALQQEYPEVNDVVLGVTGSEVSELISVLENSKVEKIYIITYAQGTVLALAPQVSEDIDALKTVVSKLGTLEEKDGHWLISRAPEITFASLQPTKEYESIASLPVDTALDPKAVLTYRTYANLDIGTLLTGAVNSMPVSSASLVLHSMSQLVTATSGSLSRLADGGYFLLTDSTTSVDLAPYFPQKQRFDTTLLAHVPPNTKELLGIYIDPKALDSFKEFLKKEVSTEASTIFANFLSSWIQDTLKTMTPEAFVAELPSTSLLLLKNDQEQLAGIAKSAGVDTFQPLFDQLYSASRFAYALEEVPVTLPDRTKGTYLRLNEELLERNTTTASGTTMETIEKEGTVLLTKHVDEVHTSISAGTGSLLQTFENNDIYTVVQRKFTQPLTGIAAKTMVDPIGQVLSTLLSEDIPVKEKKLFVGYKIFKNRVHLEFILK